MKETLQLALRALDALHVECGQLSPATHDILASAVCAIYKEQQQSDTHPDTERLNHLIEWDHCITGYVNGDQIEADGTIEKIEFIFENLTGDTNAEVVRAAIDKSIARREIQHEPT